ncbi:MAG: hypothetical protein WAX89_04660 [Alphaproteobacteria bacterium]
MDNHNTDPLNVTRLSNAIAALEKRVATMAIPATETVTVERVVEKMVEVEKPITIEKIVEKVVEVEKLVTVEKVVEKIVEKPVEVVVERHIPNPAVEKEIMSVRKQMAAMEAENARIKANHTKAVSKLDVLIQSVLQKGVAALPASATASNMDADDDAHEDAA